MRTLTPDLAGPVSVTTLAKHAAAVLHLLRTSDQVVPVSRHGHVVAILRPATVTGALRLGVDIEDPTRRVSAREFGRGNPSEFVRRAERGETLVVTLHNEPFALVQPAAEWRELDAVSEDLGDPADARAAMLSVERPGPVRGH